MNETGPKLRKPHSTTKLSSKPKEKKESHRPSNTPIPSTRGNYKQLIYAALGAAFIGGGFYALRPSVDPTPVPAQTTEKRETDGIRTEVLIPPVIEKTSPETGSLQNPEEVTDKLIEKAERAMRSLEQRLKAKTANMKDEQLKEALTEPFKIFHGNEKNPNKNIERLKNRMREQGIKSMDAPLQYFGYALLSSEKKGSGTSAAFSPRSRAINLQIDFDPEDTIDALVLYHEVRHAADDMKYRKLFEKYGKLDEYLKFIKQGKVVISAEGMAFATQIEAADILLDGKMRTTSPNNIPAIRTLHHALNGKETPRDIGAIRTLVNLASYLYPMGLKDRQVPEEFAKKIADLYGELGELYFITEDARIVPFEPKKIRK